MMSVNGAWARVVTVSVAAEIGAAVTGADAETGAEVWIFGADAAQMYPSPYLEPPRCSIC